MGDFNAQLGIPRNKVRSHLFETAACRLQLERQTWAKLEKGIADAGDAGLVELVLYIERASYDSADFELYVQQEVKRIDRSRRFGNRGCPVLMAQLMMVRTT